MTWSVELVVPPEAAGATAAALDPFVEVLSSFEEDRGTIWRIVGYAESEPNQAGIQSAVAVAALAAGIAAPPVVIAELPPTDWLAENRRSFEPVRAGRFFIRSAQRDDQPPAGVVEIVLDAGPAFGSGTHPTTQGCLLALDQLARARGGRRPRRPQQILDLGTGSGILAIAAAKLWPGAPVWATDIDPVAAVTTMENARANRVHPYIRAVAGPGLRALPPGIGGFDVILANILANPLVELAGAVRRHGTPGAVIVLSGLLREQGDRVRLAYAAHGGTLEKQLDIGDWRTLIVRMS